MSPVSTDWCITDTHLTASPASMPDPDEEGKMICQTSFFFFPPPEKIPGWQMFIQILLVTENIPGQEEMEEVVAAF